MTVEQFRAVRTAVPFVPFTIHLAGGRSLTVKHRDYVAQSPGGRVIIVYESEEAGTYVDLALVTELQLHQPAAATENGPP